MKKQNDTVKPTIVAIPVLIKIPYPPRLKNTSKGRIIFTTLISMLFQKIYLQFFCAMKAESMRPVKENAPVASTKPIPKR
jgi:hypothetical protein